MERVGEHPVPAGPLAVRWLAVDVPELRAGERATLRVRLRNAGSATWRSRDTTGVQASYHWLDPLGNPIVWDGPRTALARPVRPGEEAELALELQPPQPPGRYRLAVDLLDEFRYWFAELGSAALELDVDVRPRIAERRLGVALLGGFDRDTAEALARQDEPVVDEGPVAVAHLVAGASPAADWSRRILDAHAEGFAAVGGSIETRDRALRPWAPGGGRNPTFPQPLLLPSLLFGLGPEEYLGLPAYRPDGETWIFDGRIRLRLRRGRRHG